VTACLTAGAAIVRTQAPALYKPDKPIAIVGGLLVDGTGGAPKQGYTVLMEGEKISQVGPSASVKVPAGAEVIDATGMTVMPGLINSNQHIQLNAMYPAPTANLPLAALRARWENNFSNQPKKAYWYLMQGITSMRQTSGPYSRIMPVKHAIEKGELAGPRIYLGGALLMSKEYFAHYTRNTPPDAVEWLRKEFAYAVISDVDKDTDQFMGPDFHYWKLYMAEEKWNGSNDFTDEQLRFMIDKAHKAGKKIDVHATGNNDGLRRMLAFDVDTLEHPFYGAEVIPWDIVNGYAKKKVIAASLLNVMIVGAQRAQDPHRFDESLYAMSLDPKEYRALMDYRDRMLANQRKPDDPALPPYDTNNPPDAPDVHLTPKPSTRKPGSYAQQQKNLANSKENMRRFIEAGIKFSTGTDTNSHMNFMQEDPMVNEMVSMVELGMSPVEVIAASTLYGAEALGIEKDLGSIATGKLADVIVVAGNPLQNMAAMKRVAYVVKGGVRYK
jgi:imidazolonepropionase-like amidohydrolase